MLRLCLTAVAVALCLSVPVKAQDYALVHFESFRDICLVNGADPEKAAAAAQARGWVPAPREVSESFQDEFGKDARILVNMRGALESLETLPRAALLVTGVIPRETTGVLGGDICAVLPLRSDWDDTTRVLSGWFGFAPLTEDDNGDPLWVYSEANGVRESAEDLLDVPEGLPDEAYATILRAKQYYLVGLIEFDSDPGMMIVRAVY